jgi:uncharacterized membrane protein YedE/YeeE
MRLLRAHYEILFGRPWPVWGAALLVAMANVFLFAFERPLSASDGLRNWGDWVLRGAGVVAGEGLAEPWLYSGSLLDLGMLAGGLVAALLSREFAVRVPPRGELVKGLVGGVCLGSGAILAFGCNIGGFFSAISALSLSGLGMMVGLAVGAVIGLRYLLWEMAHRPAWSSGRGRSYLAPRADGASRQPVAGALVLLVLLALPFVYSAAGYGARGVFLYFGLVFGIVLQRSRFCLVRAFREPFMTGDGEHTRAAALAIVVSMLGFAILKFGDLKDRADWVFPSAGVGALAGGTIFGIGMVLAGGCGAGSVWRAGEGQVKLWATLVTFALGASLTRVALVKLGWLPGKLGAAVFLPGVLGWAGAIGLVIAVMAAWAWFATWNEETGRFSSA